MSSARPVSPISTYQHAAGGVASASDQDLQHSEITRSLCAAAYMHSNFRHQVIKHCVDEEHKAIGPCFGMDLVTVTRHCLIAERKLGRRDLWLFALTLLVIAVVALGDPDASLAVLFIVLPVSFALCLWQKLRVRYVVSKNFRRGKFNPDVFAGEERRDLSFLRDYQNGNAVIYSGFSPFVGSGLDLNGWSFALDVSKGSEDVDGHRRGPKPFEIAELYEYVNNSIRQLHLDERVAIEDKIYVNGQDIRDDRRFLDAPLSRPTVNVDPRVIKSAMEESSQQLRHYRCIRVTDWSGELVLSIFLRFYKLGHNLFVETNNFLLTPLHEEFRSVDSMPLQLSLKQLFGYLVYSLFIANFLLVVSPLVILGRLQRNLERWRERRAERKSILENSIFDYGARVSIRQWTSSGFYRRYFQKLDKEMYFKILEKNILDSILTFLEERDVDISDLKQRQTTILNNGVMMSGGSIKTESLAVGERAKSVAGKISKAASKVMTTAVDNRS